MWSICNHSLNHVVQRKLFIYCNLAFFKEIFTKKYAAYHRSAAPPIFLSYHMSGRVCILSVPVFCAHGVHTANAPVVLTFAAT